MRKILALLLLFILAEPARAQFADQATWAATSGGTANAQTITVPNATTFADVLGVPIRFIVGNTNTGATTLTMAGTAATAVRKSTTAGIAALIAGDWVAGQVVTVVYDGTFWQAGQVQPPVPTTQDLTSGTSATYTTPAGVRQLRIRMVAGGGGGASSSGNGVNGSPTLFGSFTVVAGSAGTPTVPGVGGSGGTGSAIRVPGARGASAGYGGGSTPFGGAGSTGPSPGAGGAAVANTGAGGAAYVTYNGAGPGTLVGGGGGGGGEYAEIVINSPAATYLYTVGAGGAGGSSGTTGGAGGSGRIIVEEIY